MTDSKPSGKAPHVQASFINALAEEGSREELVQFLQEQWNETCAARAEIKALKASEPAQPDPVGYACAIEQAVKACTAAATGRHDEAEAVWTDFTPQEMMAEIRNAIRALTPPADRLAVVLAMPEVRALVVPPEFLSTTFAVQHNPNCPSPWLVRLHGKGQAFIDLKPYSAFTPNEEFTKDALGFGKTLAEAYAAALAALVQP